MSRLQFGVSYQQARSDSIAAAGCAGRLVEFGQQLGQGGALLGRSQRPPAASGVGRGRPWHQRLAVSACQSTRTGIGDGSPPAPVAGRASSP